MALTVLTYNICEGGAERIGALAEVIRDAGADAVALTEVTPASAQALARELAMELTFGPSNSIFDLHVAWLTRGETRGARNHRLPALSKTLLEVDVDGVRLFVTHLASRHEEHAHPRAGEVAAILHVLERVGEPHVLAGDLNALQPGDPTGTFPPGVEPRGDALPHAARIVLGPLAKAGYVDCYRRLHPGDPGFTYPADAPWLRLDYVFATAPVGDRLLLCDVLTTEKARTASDHLPVVARFG
jgi:endonuclease/exonuclease/phosphatase family metal-dependent hydrolase